MRLSELGTKEIINLYNGERLGTLGEAELVLDEETGDIEEIIVPARAGLFRSQRETVIPWSVIRRIGPEVIIVEVEPDLVRLKR